MSINCPVDIIAKPDNALLFWIIANISFNIFSLCLI